MLSLKWSDILSDLWPLIAEVRYLSVLMFIYVSFCTLDILPKVMLTIYVGMIISGEEDSVLGLYKIVWYFSLRGFLLLILLLPSAIRRQKCLAFKMVGFHNT